MAAEAAAIVAKYAGGELLFAGGTDWAMLGRAAKKGADADREDYPNLLVPHRLHALSGIRIAFIAAGSAAVHCMAGDMEGRLYTWGRNEKGQLGHGDLIQRNAPKVVEGLAGKFVTAAAGGKLHTAVVTDAGESYAFGCNSAGQCGVGSIKNRNKVPKVDDLILNPAKVTSVSNVTAVTAGVDFTLWLCGGKVWAAGSPQYGQLGDGSNHEYNSKDSSIKMEFDPQPTPKAVSELSTKNVLRIVAGHSHSLAVDDEGACYSWGNGGYGRLGHKVQKDEFKPKRIETMMGRLAVPKNAVIGAGSTASFCTGVGGQMYAWGKLKTSGDNQMYPTPLSDLSGWNVRSLSCGPMSFGVAADSSTITWGNATNGELAYGVDGKKSSAKPDKCYALEGVHTEQVACGSGFTLFLSDPDATVVKEAPQFKPAVAEEAAAGEEEEKKGKGGKKAPAAVEPKAKAAGVKRKAPAAAEPKGKAKKKAAAEDEDDE